jgi:hypothetical protein
MSPIERPSPCTSAPTHSTSSFKATDHELDSQDVGADFDDIETLIAGYELDSQDVGADFDDVETVIAGHERDARLVGADVYDPYRRLGCDPWW